MSNNPNLNDLLEDQENIWLKENLLHLFALLNLGEEAFHEETCFSFSFPLSKENLILNLHRTTKVHKYIITEHLEKFENEFKDFFNLKIISTDDEYKYILPSGTHWHPKKYPCSDLSEIYYILKDELAQISLQLLEALNLNAGKITQDIFKKVQNVGDLFYLSIIKFISKDSLYKNPYRYDDEFQNDLKILMEIANIDEEIIDFFLYSNHPFQIDIQNLIRFLRIEEKLFVSFYSHHFNSSSCYIKNNVYINDTIAKRIIQKIEEIPINEFLNKSYYDTKKSIGEETEETPLFKYNYMLEFLKFYKSILHRNDILYIFDIEDNEIYMKALGELKKNKVIEIQDDEILIFSEDRFQSKYNKILNQEEERIKKNKRKLLARWLRFPLNFKEDLTPDLEEKPEQLIKQEKIPKAKIEDLGVKPIIKPNEDFEKSLRIYIGNDFEKKPFYWTPLSEPNAHLIIVGQPGVGKTQTILAIIKELKNQGINSVIFDFKKDYYLLEGKIDNLINIDANKGITINPLELELEQKTDPKHRKYQIASILKNLYNLGDVQIQMLRVAIQLTYEKVGILENDEKSWKKNAPKFSYIKEILLKMMDSSKYRSNRKEIERLLTRLEPIFDINLFSKETQIRFDEIINNITVIDFSQLPTDDLSKVAAEFLLRKIRYYIYKMGPINEFGNKNFFRFYCVIDEGHRLAYDKSPLAEIMRELRSYGVGIILASQRPSDFSDTIFANASTKICLGLPLEKDAKFMEKQINCSIKEIKNLNPFQGYIKNTKNKKTISIEIKPFFKRL